MFNQKVKQAILRVLKNLILISNQIKKLLFYYPTVKCHLILVKRIAKVIVIVIAKVKVSLVQERNSQNQLKIVKMK